MDYQEEKQQLLDQGYVIQESTDEDLEDDVRNAVSTVKEYGFIVFKKQ